jgi:hypothetical protein
MHEVLSPTRLDLDQEYERGFDGMTTNSVSLQDLIDTRERIIETMTEDMPSEHKQLLVSFVSGNPDWSSFNIESAKDLPAVQWRAMNLDKLEKKRREELAGQLASVVGL